MGFLKKKKVKLEDLNGFLKEIKSKVGGYTPIGGRMESMLLGNDNTHNNLFNKHHS